MATFKDLEDNLKNFMIQEQSDAHSSKTLNTAKYNNLKIWMEPSKFPQSHFIVRISISEAAFNLEDCNKINGGLGYEERIYESSKQRCIQMLKEKANYKKEKAIILEFKPKK